MRIKVKDIDEVIRLKDAIETCPGEILVGGIKKENIFEKILFNTPLEVKANHLNIKRLEEIIPELVVREYTAKITVHATGLVDAMSILSKAQDVEIQYLVKTEGQRLIEIA